MAPPPRARGTEPYRRPPFHKMLSFRLTMIFAASLAIVIVGLYVFLYRQHSANTLRLIDKQLSLSYRLVRPGGIESIESHRTLQVRLVDARGNLRAASPALRGAHGAPLPLPMPARLPAGSEGSMESVEVDWHPHRLRVATFRVSGPGEKAAYLQIAFPLDTLEQTLSKFTTAIVILCPVVLAITVISGLSIAKKALGPIVGITQTAQRITAENLSDRLAVSDAGDELDLLSETLNDMIARLQASFERTRRFTADASHELRTPLTALRGETEIVLRTPHSPEEYREVLASNLEEVERLSTIVSDLLVLSRSELRSDLRLEQLDLGDLLGEIATHIKVLADQKGIALHHGSLPHSEIVGDRGRLTQLFSNLLDNAVKYTPRGGTIRLELEDNQEFACVRISDSGVGIPDGDLPHVFERFYRVDHARAGHDTSTGLGLSICKWIVGSHNGTIDVESTEGSGTTFTVRIPHHGGPS